MNLREDIAALTTGSRCLVCSGWGYKKGEVTRISRAGGGADTSVVAFYVKVDGSGDGLMGQPRIFLPDMIFGDSLEGRKHLLACLERCADDLVRQEESAREAIAELQDVLESADDETEGQSEGEGRLILIGRPVGTAAAAAAQPTA